MIGKIQQPVVPLINSAHMNDRTNSIANQIMYLQKKYVALATADYEKIIAEGKSMQFVIEEANKAGEDYIIAPVLDKNTSYIFQ